jgi:hypothetical protein
LKGLRLRFSGGTGPFPERSVEIIEGLVRELFSEDRPSVLLHGDFHHFNILLSERGWLVIDPKGVAGPAEYEVGPLLLNPWGEMPDETEAIRRTQRPNGWDSNGSGCGPGLYVTACSQLGGTWQRMGPGANTPAPGWKSS